MWVHPGARRAGVGTAVLRSLATAAAARGASSLHLQTDVDNTSALALYEAQGFERHHQYVNVSRR
jgi:N-acetylglutamate synthase